MDFAAIRARLNTKLQGTGWNPYPFLPGSPDLPAAVVGLPELIEYGDRMKGGRPTITIAVRLYASAADPTKAVARIDAAISTVGPTSIWAALRAVSVDDPWRQAVITGVSNVAAEPLDNGVAVIAADLNLTITTNQ